MKKDIERPSVENVTLAVLKEGENGTTKWSVHLINNNNFPLENTLVASKGYGEAEGGEEQKTSTLRHFLETIEANSTAQIELITDEVFHLNNEYWLSYYVDGLIHDKRFVFVPDSIQDDNLVFIKELDGYGILHS